MDIYKSQARRLRSRLDELGITLSHSHALEGVAAVHGARNWQTLQGIQFQSQQLPVTSTPLAEMCEVCCDYDLQDVVAATPFEDGWWLAIRSGEDVSCAVQLDHRPDKLYYEGDAVRCNAPQEILSVLTETDDEKRLAWRRSAEIIHLRQHAMDRGQLCPWTIWAPGCELDLKTEGPHYCIPVDDSCQVFDITNGDSLVRKKLTVNQIASLYHVGDEKECIFNEPALALNAGRAPVRWQTLGGPGYEVLAGFTPQGALVGYSGLPWQIMESHFQAASDLDPGMPLIAY